MKENKCSWYVVQTSHKWIIEDNLKNAIKYFMLLHKSQFIKSRINLLWSRGCFYYQAIHYLLSASRFSLSLTFNHEDSQHRLTTRCIKCNTLIVGAVLMNGIRWVRLYGILFDSVHRIYLFQYLKYYKLLIKTKMFLGDRLNKK